MEALEQQHQLRKMQLLVPVRGLLGRQADQANANDLRWEGFKRRQIVLPTFDSRTCEEKHNVLFNIYFRRWRSELKDATREVGCYSGVRLIARQ